MERLTEADLARIRGLHVKYANPFSQRDQCQSCVDPASFGPTCESWEASSWPCDAARLLAELDQRNNAVRAWQGRHHLPGMMLRCIYCDRTDPPRGFFPIGQISVLVLGVHKVGQVCNECHDRLEIDGEAFMAELAGVAAGLLGPSTSEELAR